MAITELDDRIQGTPSSANLTRQASDYAAVVRACLAVSRRVGMTKWDVGDPDSWVPSAFPGWGSATMYNNGYQPKPAYTATQQALGGRPEACGPSAALTRPAAARSRAGPSAPSRAPRAG